MVAGVPVNSILGNFLQKFTLDGNKELSDKRRFQMLYFSCHLLCVRCSFRFKESRS